MSDNVTWLVRQIHWRRLPTSAEPRYVRFPGATTVAEFDDRTDAEADQWAREVGVRGRVNPFRCGFDLADLTHIPDFAFKDFLMDDSIRPAKYDSYARVDWGKWWDKHSPAWTADRKARIWEALDKVRFFQVVGREAGRQLFVAVEGVSDFQPVPRWDRWGYVASEFGTEGGRPVRAFRTRADADAHFELAAETNDDPARTQRDTDPFTHPDAPARLSADRVHDVPLDGEVSAELRTVFVVCRAGLRDESRYHHRLEGWQVDDYRSGSTDWGDEYIPLGEPFRRPLYSPRLVPEAAFTTREAAEADVVVRTRAARRWLNPHLISDVVQGTSSRAERAARWWSANVSNAPDAEFDAAWAGFAHLSLYHVLGVEFDG